MPSKITKERWERIGKVWQPDTNEYQEEVRAKFAENPIGVAPPGITILHSVPEPRQTPTELAAKVGGSFIMIVEEHTEPVPISPQKNYPAQN
ncbi:MAG: hypothetical protein R2682_01285 [Pyrinomonadaceae bacterium]